MGYEVKPVYGPDLSQLLMQGLGAYRQVKGIQQQEAQTERQEQKWEQEDADRFAKESIWFAGEVADMPLDEQIAKTQERIKGLRERGISSAETERLLSGLQSQDPAQRNQALQAIKQRREWGYQSGMLKRPPSIKSPEAFKNAAGLRKEIDSATKEFNKVSDAFSRIKATAEEGKESAAGDMALLFNYMKMLDPNSVVRESEYATAANAGSVPERLRAQYNSVVNGQKLSAKQRADFLNQAGNLYNVAEKQNDTTIQSYIRLGERFNIPKEDIIVKRGRPEKEKKKLNPEERYNLIVKEKYKGVVTPEQAQEILQQLEKEGYTLGQ
jgi:DNA-binding transcriptional MerR regulator